MKREDFLCEACYALNSRQAPNHQWKGNPGIAIFSHLGKKETFANQGRESYCNSMMSELNKLS